MSLTVTHIYLQISAFLFLPDVAVADEWDKVVAVSVVAPVSIFNFYASAPKGIIHDQLTSGCCVHRRRPPAPPHPPSEILRRLLKRKV